MCTKSSLFVVATIVLPGVLAADDASRTKPVVAEYEKLPLSFEPNEGQAERRVDFVAHGKGYSLFLARAEAVLVQHNGTAIRMKPTGGDRSARPEALGPLPGKSNYFTSSDPAQWRTGVPNYAKVRYRDVYPGIDMIYYGTQRQLEYDFVVSPGANPSTISLNFQGARKAELTREGELVMHTTEGDMRWHKPLAYQEVNGSRTFVACDYVRRGGQHLGFKLGAYDRAKGLIIDPILEYSTYLGGSDTSGVGDAAFGIAVDSHGEAYVTGYSNSLDFPTKNPLQQKHKGGVFVTKIDAAA